MHQPIHDTTEAALLEALDSWAWWERTCEHWREQCQQAQRERDLARYRSEVSDKLEAITTLSIQKRCVFHLAGEYDDERELNLGWRVEGPRGMNNANMGYRDDLRGVLDEMLDWLRTAEEKPWPEPLH